MKIEITVGELRDSSQALAALGKMVLPPPVSFRIARVMNLVSPILEQSDKQINEIVSRYAAESKEVPGRWDFESDEAREGFQAEAETLMAEEVSLEFKPIKIAEMGDKEVSPSILAACMWLFDEE